MLSYFVINSIVFFISFFSICFARLSAKANYLLSLLAILVWLIPYGLISSLIPTSVLAEPVIVSFASSSLVDTGSEASLNRLNIEVALQILFNTLISCGVIIFIYRMHKLYNMKKRLFSSNTLTPLPGLSNQHDIPIFSTKYHLGGYLLGVLNPIIVISSKIQENRFIELIISHEKQHLKRNDNLRLLILEFFSCIFWWNPLVSKMINLNRFYIEALCDEGASKKYGKDNYINDLSSLTLFIGLHKTSQLASNILSPETSTTSRIKLLKENRKMSFKTKLLFASSIFAITAAVSWNTLATATPGRDTKPAVSNAEEIGSLVVFDIDILYKTETSGEFRTESSHSAELTVWSKFGEKSSFKFNDEFSFNYRTTDLDDLIMLELELIEKDDSENVIVASPALKVAVGKETVIEIDNKDISQNTYKIKAIAFKKARPTE